MSHIHVSNELGHLHSYAKTVEAVEAAIKAINGATAVSERLLSSSRWRMIVVKANLGRESVFSCTARWGGERSAL